MDDGLVTTLADGFLDDLDELDDSDEEVDDDAEHVGSTASSSASASAVASADAPTVAAPGRKRADGLRVKESFVEHMRRVRALLSEAPLPLEGVLETHPEYLLIVKSNTLLLEIVDEIGRVHRRLADVYAKRFPELETLVPNPLVYVRVAQRIGNELDMMTVNLDDLLPSAQVMVVTVTGSTSVGAALSSEAYGEVVEACAEALELEAARNDIMSFVEGRMGVIAPNLSAIVGTMVAAALLGKTGGLRALANVPSCDLQVVGQEKLLGSQAAGFGAAATMPNMGLISLCELVQAAPAHLKRKILRVVSAKSALAIRADAFDAKQRLNPTMGRELREKIEKKLEQMLAPTRGRGVKALPKPDARPARKRGGRKYRRAKEMRRMTEMAQQRNRLSFNAASTDEYSDAAMGNDRGMLGRSGAGGRMRIATSDSKSQGIKGNAYEQSRSKKKGRGISAPSSTRITSGLASSVVFTPVQGLELADPDAMARLKRKRAAADDGYFSTAVGFNAGKSVVPTKKAR